jgi:hypothetical protein
LPGNFRLELGGVLDGFRPASVTIYNPWKNLWSDAKLEAGTLSLPAFSRSLVVRLTGFR